jgi:two-component system, OmpR family, sensor kinase
MRSFGFQLAIRAALAVAVGLTALSGVTIVTLRSILDREIDASILNIASIQAASLADGPSGDMHFHEWDITADEAASVRDLVQYAQVWDADGVSLLRSRYMTVDLPADPDALAMASGGELTWARQDFEGSPVRTLYYPLERLGAVHEAHVLQVAAPLARSNGMMRRTSVFLGLLTVLLAVGTFGGSWWLAGSAVRPIHEVIDQAEEIGGRSLDRRIQAYADTTEYTRLVEVLNTMLARLQSAFDAQRRFTADASHELRSPLTAMRGEVEVALRRPRSPEEYVEVLESTLEEVIRLSRISEDLLTLARSDSLSLVPAVEVVDVAEVVARVLERLQPTADQEEVELLMETPDPLVVTVDPGVLWQIVWNLTDNALRFTPAGGEVRLAVRDAGEKVVLTVDDNGPGVGPQADTVFERFFQADAARTHRSEPGGTGLGLAIVKALAEAHGGDVHAEDRPGGGARFTVTLAHAAMASPVRSTE